MSAASITVPGRLRGAFAALPARHRRYVLACLIANAVIWGIALTWLAIVPPTYVVHWSLIIPASDADARVSLTNVGQAYSAPRSSYDARSLDPRVNYREIALSEPVLHEAARLAGVAPARFPQPRIKLIDQSSVMEFELAAASGEAARRMAEALNVALRARLDALRADESGRREQGVEAAIDSARASLEAAQHAVVEFKISSQIVSADQLSRIGEARVALEDRRRELEQSVAHLSAGTGVTRQLLGVTPARAAHAIVVQSDSLFMEHYRQYVAATALLTEYSYKFGEQHPRVVTERKRQGEMFGTLVRRAREINGAGLDAAEVRRLVVLLEDRNREALFSAFVGSAAELQALREELAAVDRQLEAMAADQDRLARSFATLEELERRLMFAEAVFNSTLGKTDVGRADVYSSYPLLQDLVTPAAPERPSAPVLALVLLGALASAVFATGGLTLAWMRDKNARATANA